MKSVIKLILAAAFLCSCSQDDKDGKTLDGTETGGGGDLLAPMPIDVKTAKALIQQSKFYLQMHAKWRTYSVNPSASKIDKVPGDFLKLVNANLDKIEIRENDHCRDAGSRKVDASIYAADGNVICISAFALKDKIFSFGPKRKKYVTARGQNVRTQLMALLAHEFSHLMGTNEPEAVDIQNHISTNLSDSAYEALYEALYVDSQSLVMNLKVFQKVFKDRATILTLAKTFAFEVQEAKDYLEKYRYVLGMPRFSSAVENRFPYVSSDLLYYDMGAYVKIENRGGYSMFSAKERRLFEEGTSELLAYLNMLSAPAVDGEDTILYKAARRYITAWQSETNLTEDQLLYKAQHSHSGKNPDLGLVRDTLANGYLVPVRIHQDELLFSRLPELMTSTVARVELLNGYHDKLNGEPIVGNSFFAGTYLKGKWDQNDLEKPVPVLGTIDGAEY